MGVAPSAWVIRRLMCPRGKWVLAAPHKTACPKMRRLTPVSLAFFLRRVKGFGVF